MAELRRSGCHVKYWSQRVFWDLPRSGLRVGWLVEVDSDMWILRMSFWPPLGEGDDIYGPKLSVTVFHCNGFSSCFPGNCCVGPNWGHGGASLSLGDFARVAQGRVRRNTTLYSSPCSPLGFVAQRCCVQFKESSPSRPCGQSLLSLADA